MSTDINQYLKLRTALVNEKAKLEARLAAISKVLGQGAPATPAPAAKRGGRRQFSEATKAKMRAAQKARWAKLKGNAATTKTPAVAPKKKRKMSTAGRAAIIAAAKARWAKVKMAAGEAGK